MSLEVKESAAHILTCWQFTMLPSYAQRKCQGATSIYVFPAWQGGWIPLTFYAQNSHFPF